MFLALHDGEVVGCAGLGLDADNPTRAENALTAVRRDWRGRGIAVHLKQRTLAWAAEHGIAEVYTWTQDGNAAMRALNTRLGYATTRTGIQVARALPLGLIAPFPSVRPTTSVIGVGHLLRASLTVATALALAPVAQAASAPAPERSDRSAAAPRLQVRTVVRGLEHSWDVQEAPGGRLLVTERDRARLSVVRNGTRRTLADLSEQVWVSGETGLMSIAVDRRRRVLWACHGARTATATRSA